ncbi:hypothetical protein LCGC14_1693810 [marine sediment metagenome]|uniref:Uncharacterized protein n=1 Tax=marine sediment metagenome TaxID=412755 RepID=A0A0F8Y2D3_9ZZZZ
MEIDEISTIYFYSLFDRINVKVKLKTLRVIWGADLYEYLPLKLYNQYISELFIKLLIEYLFSMTVNTKDYGG